MISISTNFLTFLQASLSLILVVTNIHGVTSDFADDGVKCRQGEWMALVKFKAQLIDDYGRLSTWGFEGVDKMDCCEWKGVLCDNRTNHVVGLDLRGPVREFLPLKGEISPAAPLRGKISPSLLELAHLNYLDLSFNNFSQSQIPEFIGSLGKLQHLNLSSSNFGGLIPHYLGNLSMLQFLDLSGNLHLTDTNLDWLSGIQSLEYLDLSFVNLQKATTWLQAINKLTAVKEIYLQDCQLSNFLPISFPPVNSSNSLVALDLAFNNLNSSAFLLRFLNMSSNFIYIDFFSNNLEGRIPDALRNLRSLSHLDLSNCSLKGSIPDALGNLTSLSYLALSFNFLEGSIPDFLGNLSSLSHLDLSSNQLQGEFPRTSKNLSSLRFLDLSANKFNGELPHLMMRLWDCTKLESLSLMFNLFYGSLPNMSRFSVLKELRLRDNQLNGSLIEGNVRLPNLEILDLAKNMFTGRVPNLSSCSSLKWLVLNDNKFNGTLTESIGSLSKIVTLNLASNRLEGLITEAHFLSLSQLRWLDLSFNLNLTIRVRSSWKHPFQLIGLRLAYCKLRPYFPQWLHEQEQVNVLDISNTIIFDAIPDWFWDNIQMCSYLNMSHNQIFGVLPDLSSKVDLSIVDLSSNEFTGSLPILPPVVYNIDLSRNKFSGTILNFCNFKYLYLVLDLSNNQLSGEIPQDCFMNLLSLVHLNLANNNFSGEIPNSMDLVCGVRSLHLRNNVFRGEIPRSLKNCSDLKILDLGENEFTGNIPGWLGESMPGLGILILKSNKLFGILPSSLCHLTKLQVLDISMNKITGVVPKCMNNFTFLSSESHLWDSSWDSRFMIVRNGTGSSYDSASVIWKGKEEKYIKALGLLKLIDLSSNNLIGEIPREIMSLVGLLGLNLSRNNLVGSIPHDIGQLELLNFLDLSKNNLSGSVPATLSQLSHLGVLDLSFNNFSGRIPWDKHMQTFSASTYLGNPGLCGPPLVNRPCNEDEMPDGTDNSEDDEDVFITRGFYISMVLGFIVAFWGVFGLNMFISVEDWLYVKILVNKRRLLRYFGNSEE